MCERNQVWLILVLVLILAGGIFASFMAPCGCYAGTSIKDAPLRCVQPEGVPSR